MKVSIHSTPADANLAATDCLASWLTLPSTSNVMVAAGNSPLELYRLIAGKRLALSHLHLFALDEYVGVPLEEPRNCGNLLKRCVADAWGVPPSQFHAVSSLEQDAEWSIHEHERLLAQSGGLDVLVLGLGQNGHLGFNEPGSAEDSPGRLLDLETISIEANRKWFSGDYAPQKGVTAGIQTLLSARHVLILAYGGHKRLAVQRMVEGPRGSSCPASFLQEHVDTTLFIDDAAASGLSGKL